jgi:hypothetical protein
MEHALALLSFLILKEFWRSIDVLEGDAISRQFSKQAEPA